MPTRCSTTPRRAGTKPGCVPSTPRSRTPTNPRLRRAENLRAERATLIHELAAATGLGGRSRRLGDPAERARKTVSARVRDALSKIDRRPPAAGPTPSRHRAPGHSLRVRPSPSGGLGSHRSRGARRRARSPAACLAGGGCRNDPESRLGRGPAWVAGESAAWMGQAAAMHFVGVDLAWGDRKPTGLAVLDGDGAPAPRVGGEHRRLDRGGPGALRGGRLPGRDRCAADRPQRDREPTGRGRAEQGLRPLRRRCAPVQHGQAGVPRTSPAARGSRPGWGSTSTRDRACPPRRSRSIRIRRRSRCSGWAGR